MAPSPAARSTRSSANRLRSPSRRPTPANTAWPHTPRSGSLAGLQPDEILASRRARAVDAKRDAGLKFAQAVVVNRGDVSDDGAQRQVRAAGFTDGEITEIVAHVALNIFTNYINLVARTIVDFPRVELSIGAAA